MKKNNLIALAPNQSAMKRNIAFLSILTVYFFYCYNFLIGTFTRPTMLKAVAEGGFGFSQFQAASIFSVMSFATIPGTILFGIMATKIGKKRTLMAIAASIAAFTALPLLAPTNVQFWRAARFVTGFALGGVFGTAVPLVAEMYEPKYRGKLAAICTSTFSVAFIFGGKLYGAIGDSKWILLVLTAVIPQIIGFFLVGAFVPDDRELTAKRNAESLKNKGESISYFSMYKGKYLWIGIGAIVLSGMNFLGYSLFSNNSVTFLRNTGYTASEAGNIAAVRGTGMLIGYNMWGLIADKFGRKVPLVGILAAGVGVFFYTKLGPGQATMYKYLTFFIGLMIGFSGAWGAYYTELFPKRFGGLSAGMSFNGGRIISTFGIPWLTSFAELSNLGIAGTIRFGAYAFMVGTIVWLLLPETLNKVREE